MAASRAWGILLAGGDGTRLQEESRARYGYPRPKQFCDFDGRGTLLGKTVERVLALVPQPRVVVSINRSCRREAVEALEPWPRTRLVEQPHNRETTPGILLPLLQILREDPRATVLVLPSDHHVRHLAAFQAALRRCVHLVRANPDRLLLLGAVPEQPEKGYGWIVPRRLPGEPWAAVMSFREKPPPDEAERLWRHGALLNTFVMAASAHTLARLISRHVPEWWRALCLAGNAPEQIHQVYATLPSSNFSTEVLEHAENLRVVGMRAGWSDVGTPERLQRELLATPQSDPRHREATV